MKNLLISPRLYTYKDFKSFYDGPIQVTLAKKSLANLQQSYKRLQKQINSGKTIYGVNTGFGKLSQIKIDTKDQKALQLNLVRSHASAIGNPLDAGLVRTILVLKLLTYVKGFSGVRPIIAKKICQFINNDILPVIPEKGSVGASGDLAPLGHLALALIGEGDVFYNGKKVSAKIALKKSNVKPIVLFPKEGLSLINGTQMSTALAIKALIKGETLIQSADIIGALSVENSLASRNVFKKNIHQLKSHPGQIISARNVYKMLRGSKIVDSHVSCNKVQDPYSFRCIPHIHGASRDSFVYASKIINNEINSVSDNPLILDNGDIVTSGHFHAEHISQAMDFISIAMSELGAVSERRTHFFMKGIDNLINPFIAKNPGLDSGYMIAHVTATALASENKTLAHPASIDSASTSGGQEDFVSMAPWAGIKLLQIQDNLSNILAIELIVAGAANYFAFKDVQPGQGTELILDLLKSKCRYNKGDRVFSKEIETISNIIKKHELIKIVNQKISVE